MSKSRKKHPYTSITCVGDRAGTEHDFKRRAHRALRHAVRAALRIGLEVPHDRQFGDPWNGPKDGKMWFDNPRASRK